MDIKIKTDILLVIPVRDGYSGITLDLGMLYLYSALKDKGFDSTILHCPKEGITHSGWGSILRNNPHLKIIGFKMYSVDHNSVKRMSEEAKKELPGCITVAGGPHPTSLSDYVISEIRSLDYLIRGEAEVSFPAFCKAVFENRSPSGTPGLVYLSDGEVRSTPSEWVANLDDLPRIRWEDFEIDEYPDFFSSLPIVPVMATRGCPFECKYCAGHTVMGRKMRFRSIGNVLAEISLLKEKKGAKSVTFLDDELTLNRRYFSELCQALIDAGLDVEWECDNGVRLDTLDDEVLDLMYRAGCRYIAVGIESGSDRILKEMKKNITVATIRKKIAVIKHSKVVPQGLFMMGFPNETEEDIINTIRLSLDLDIDKTNFSIFMPLPGSEIFDELVKDGCLDLYRISWDDMKPDRIVFKNNNISPKRLKALQRYAYLRFYLRLKPMIRLAREFSGKRNAGRVLWSKIVSVLWD